MKKRNEKRRWREVEIKGGVEERVCCERKGGERMIGIVKRIECRVGGK